MVPLSRQSLTRSLTTLGAVIIGLGSMIGAVIFVFLGPAAAAGRWPSRSRSTRSPHHFRGWAIPVAALVVVLITMLNIFGIQQSALVTRFIVAVFLMSLFIWAITVWISPASMHFGWTVTSPGEEQGVALPTP